jgi:hypothetical protein
MNRLKETGNNTVLLLSDSDEFKGLIYDDSELIYENGSVQAEREKYAIEVKGNYKVLGKQVAN